MIKACGISKQLGTFYLNNISFKVPPGYICGLAGQNGAGKTALLHLLLGLYQADAGEIVISGMTYDKQEKEIHDITGIVLTEELFDVHYSIKENANYYGRFYSDYKWAQMETYLKQFKLDSSKPFGKLSKGEKLKSQFAFALSHNPRLLILDEPTANFDLDFREQFLQILQQFIADGDKSVILATHLTDDLDRLADYFIYLETGEQMFAGSMEAFRDAYRMVSGEQYKIQLLPKDKIIHIESGTYGAKALIKHSRLNSYDVALQTAYPTIEEFMYFFSRRMGGKPC